MKEDFDQELARYKQTQEVREEYARFKAIEEASSLIELPTRTVYDELRDDYVEPKWRIKGLHIASSFTTITAAKKTGKSTLMLNLIRSLVDGVSFLGQGVTPLDGNVAYLNMELDPNVWRRWIMDMGIESTKRIHAVHLRGERFPLYHPELEKRFVEWLKRNEIECLIIDPGHRILRGWPSASGGGENSNDVVAQVCQKLAEIKLKGEVTDLFVPLHTGHAQGESQHTRGAIMWQDDPDHLWSLWTKDIIKGDGTRHFKAEGRDVDFGTVAIGYDAATHRYKAVDLEILQGEGRAKSVVVALKGLGGAASTRELKEATKGFENGHFTGVLKDCVDRDWIRYENKRNVLMTSNPEVKAIIAFDGGAEEID